MQTTTQLIQFVLNSLSHTVTENKLEISFQINKTHKSQMISTDINKEVTGGAKVFVAVKALKEKQLLTYNERAPEVRGGRHSYELKVNTLEIVRQPILGRFFLFFLASLSVLGNFRIFMLVLTKEIERFLLTHKNLTKLGQK